MGNSISCHGMEGFKTKKGSEGKGANRTNARLCSVMSRGLPKSSSQNQERVDRTTQELNPK